MDMLEKSGLDTYVGKVNMDRNCPDYICEETKESADETLEWIKDVNHRKYKNTKPILTPRFTPSCTDELMEELKKLQMRYHLPLQSHLSENPGRDPVGEGTLPMVEFYGDVYDRFGLFGAGLPHCYGALRLQWGRRDRPHEGERSVYRPLSGVEYECVVGHCSGQKIP